jgi:hypothetical protein
VDKNRHFLGRIINCTKFCGMHELPLREWKWNILQSWNIPGPSVRTSKFR